MIDYPSILVRRYADCKWVLNGDDYDGLTWLSDTQKPSKAELDALWSEVQAEIRAEQEAKITARETALAKLSALGLSEAEIRALVG